MCVCIQVHLKKLEYHEKVQKNHSFQKVKPIYYIDSLHIEWNISSLLSLQIMKIQNSVSQKIWILHNINKKKDILNRNVRLIKSMFISMHSILGWASFCMNYCINAAWHEDNQPVALLRCNEAQVALIAAFRSSASLGLVSLIFLLPILYYTRFSMGFRSGEFAGQSSTVTPWSLNQLLVPLAVWAGGCHGTARKPVEKWRSGSKCRSASSF